jgi:5-methylcytosine-specific restriction enzyme B
MFTWVLIYRELAQKIVDLNKNKGRLLDIAKDIQGKGLPVFSFSVHNTEGEPIELAEIDPFTFFSMFNRGITDSNRTTILNHLKDIFDLKSDLPQDYNGIPLVQNTASWFFWSADKRKAEDVDKLWDIATQAVSNGVVSENDFNRCLKTMPFP